MEEFILEKELDNYKPFDQVETEHLEKIKQFLKTAKNQFERSNLVGHITGSAFLLSEDLSKILLNHHKILNKWFGFGGHSDGDINTFNVAFRETFEESGISNIKAYTNKIFDVDVHFIPKNEKKNEPEHFHCDIRFVFTTTETEFNISNESLELKWFTLNEFEKLNLDESRQRFLKKWKKII